MTVIAVLYADTTPIVLADTLISSNTWSGLPLKTPLTPDEVRPGIDGFGPVGLAQKAVAAGHGLTVLYAGVVSDAQRLIEIVWMKTVDCCYSKAIHDRVLDIAQNEQLDVSFIVLQSDADGELHRFCSPKVQKPRKDTGYGVVLVAGSCAAPLVGFLEKNRPFKPDPQDPNPIEVLNAATASVMNIASVLARDFISQDSVMAKHSCGGHYEIIPSLDLVDAKHFRAKPLPETFMISLTIEITVSDQEGVAAVLRDCQMTQRKSDHTLVFSFGGPVTIALDSPFVLPNKKWCVTRIAQARSETTLIPLPPSGTVACGPLTFRCTVYRGDKPRHTTHLIPASAQTTGMVHFGSSCVELSGVQYHMMQICAILLLS